MTEEFTLKDYWNFIKKHARTILLTMFLLLTLFIIWIFIDDSRSSEIERQQTDIVEMQFNEDIIEELMNTDFSLLNDDEQDLLMAFLRQDSYSFDFYVETDNVEPFTNFRLLKEILTAQPVVEIIEDTAQTSITPDPKRGVILSEEYGGVVSLSVGVGDEENNRRIVQAYYDLLQAETLDFFNNKTIFFLSDQPEMNQPLIYNERMAEDFDADANTNTIDNFGTNIVLGILVSIGGLVLGLIIALVKGFYSDKISDIFNYNLKKNDQIIKFDKKPANDKDFLHLLAKPQHTKKLVISDVEKLIKYTKEIQLDNIKSTEINYSTDVSEIDFEKNYGEIIILVETYKSSKDWYKKQFLLVSNYQKPIKVIQFSKFNS